MLIFGILILIVAILMVIYPEFFIEHRVPKLPKKLQTSPKMKVFTRVWGCICIIIGIVLILISLVTMTDYNIKSKDKTTTNNDNQTVNKEQEITIDEFYNDSLTKDYLNIKKLKTDYSVEDATNDKAVIVSHDMIYNPDILDNFIININTNTPAFLRLIKTTYEGDLIITDIKYNEDKVVVITDNTRDEFSNENSRKITIEEYKHIEEILISSNDKTVSSLIVYNDNKDDNRVLFQRNRLIEFSGDNN